MNVLDDSPATKQGVLLWVGLLTGIVGCGVPFVLGLVAGWPVEYVLGYGVLAALYLPLTQIPSVSLPIVGALGNHLWLYVLIMGGLGWGLQTLSGDPFLQPLVFQVPFVFASLRYGAMRTAAVAALYLGLMLVGLWMGGQRAVEAFVFPLIGYSSAMALIYAFTSMAAEQAVARRRADALAADVARQRDYLARLVHVTASLTRDLDLETVLEHVAAEGRVLAHAALARVWLRADETEAGEMPPLRVAAAVPPHAAQPTLSSADHHALHATTATTTASMLILPLVFKDAPIGVLELRDRADASFGNEDIALLQPFADAAAVAIENARLYQQARLSATLAERNRLARELHDTIAQGLTAVTMQLDAAQRSFDRDADRTRARLGRAYALARDTLDDVRRSVWTLAAPLIDGQELSTGLEALTQRVATRTGIPIRYTASGPPPMLGHAAATQVLRIVQEALHNVEKHALATAIEVALEHTATELHVRVRDNGKGFDPSVSAMPTSTGSAFGLASVHERARLAGGTLHIQSAPGAGTCITITIPHPAPTP